MVEVIKHAIMITSFVLMMMLLIEYINVQTRGQWQEHLQKNIFAQYLVSSLLGVLPGCLGAFTVVSLYSHRMVSFGALVAAMIATSGDEAFIMFSLFPLDALWINAILFLVAVMSGYLVDLMIQKQERFLHKNGHRLQLHTAEYCHCFAPRAIPQQFRRLLFERALLMTLFGLFLIAVLIGEVGPQEWDWKKITFTAGALLSLFIVSTVPDHFLKEHLYAHVVKQHLLRIFLWTLAALGVVHYIQDNLDITTWLQENVWTLLFSATAIGIIPESGPHLVFVTMYAEGLIPFAVLLASSISQDGHGTLPLLSVSLRAFITLKIINFVIALIIGISVLTLFS